MSERLSKERLDDIRRQVEAPSSPFFWRAAIADLLAEVDRLRAPASEAFLTKVRQAVDVRARCGNVWQSTNPPGNDWVPRLLAALEYTEGLLCDLLADHDLIRQEGAAERHRQIQCALATITDDDEFLEITRLLANLPPLPDALPPEQARRYAAALADCLRWFVDVYSHTIESSQYASMIEEARKLLREGNEQIS